MSSPGKSSFTVLLVEDNPGDTWLIQNMVSDLPEPRPTLIVADRMAAALDRARQQAVDIILLDLTLPDSLGIATVTCFHREFPNVPIVVLTGLDDEATAIQAMHQGAQDYLVKGDLD